MGSDIQTASRYTMIFGGNTFTDCDGLVLFEGPKETVDLFHLELNGTDLLLSMDVRDEAGQLLAKIRRNSPVFAADHFEIDRLVLSRTELSITITDQQTGEVLLAAQRLASDTWRVNGRFYAGGTLIVADDEQLVVGNLTMIGNTVHGCGAGIRIGPGSLSIG